METQPITPREPILIIKGLTVRLPASAERIHAVNQVSLEVLPREILCVVGESGSGKSVTAHSVMGLLPEDQLKTEAAHDRFKPGNASRPPDRRSSDGAYGYVLSRQKK